MPTNEYDTYMKAHYPDAKPGDLFRIIRENLHHPPHELVTGSIVRLRLDDETGWPLFDVVMGSMAHPTGQLIHSSVAGWCVGVEVLAVVPLEQEPT